MAKPPRLSDPGGEPRFPYRGPARREKPIFSREQFGPWKCDVHVVPLTGLRRGYAIFEVLVRWEQGPALDLSLGPAPASGMAASDVYYIDRESPDLQLTNQEAFELALELAKRAAELLEVGIKPNLPILARAVRRRLKY